MNQSVEFWKQWIELQLKHNLDRMVELSIKNFHFPGLNYVCFDFAPHHTIRMYIVEPADELQTREVNIHNHLYDSQILVLKGPIWNTTYKVDNESSPKDEYNIYALTSALHPDNKEKKIKLEHLMRRGLKVDTVKTMHAGESHFQPHTEIHSVENIPKELTCFMVFEFKTVKERSRIFTKQDFGTELPTKNAYQRYTHSELRNLVERTLEQL